MAGKSSPYVRSKTGCTQGKGELGQNPCSHCKHLPNDFFGPLDNFNLAAPKKESETRTRSIFRSGSQGGRAELKEDSRDYTFYLFCRSKRELFESPGSIDMLFPPSSVVSTRPAGPSVVAGLIGGPSASAEDLPVQVTSWPLELPNCRRRAPCERWMVGCNVNEVTMAPFSINILSEQPCSISRQIHTPF